jgi:hypothetical protein
MLLQEIQGLAFKVKPCFDTELHHFPRRRRPDAVKLSHRYRLDEGRPRLRRDDEEPIRLTVIRGEFRQKLVVGDAR